jgi:hypothetical protein
MAKSGQPALPGFEARTPGAVARMKRETERTITALRHAGRVETVDAARVALVRTLAEVLDAEVRAGESAYTVAVLAARYRDAVGDLYGTTPPTSDEVEAFLSSLRA